MSDPTSRLPARPSLEQLQKQAKELLARIVLRAIAPRSKDSARPTRAPDRAASRPVLADAQFVIARENGFETWAKLKHHIEGLWPESLQKGRRTRPGPD